MEKKYRLTEEMQEWKGHMLHRVKALRDFGNVKKGELGGWIESEENLSHEGDCWVGGEAKVYDDAQVRGDAQVFWSALVYGNALVCDNAVVRGNVVVRDDAVVRDKAQVCGNAVVCDNAQVCDDAVVCGDAVISKKGDYIVFKNFWSSGRFFTWTKSNDKWSVGCFYGTGDELIEKAYADSEVSGKFYQKYVEFVEVLKKC